MPKATHARRPTIILLGAIWVGAAWLLWRTTVPDDLRLPHVDAPDTFGATVVRRAARHDRFLEIDYLLALAAQLGALTVVALLARRIEPRLRGPAVVRGLELALVALAAAWLVRLPFGLAAQWWQRRYGLTPQSYGAWLLDRLPAPATLVGLLAVVAVLMLLARRLGPRWWPAGGAVLAVAAGLAVLVQPLGTTLHPLRDRTLAAELRSLERRDGLGRIETGVERVHEETSLANGAAVGLGPTRRVVFWDTLGGFPRPELRFLGAHELAHHARLHLWKGLGWFALFALPIAWLLARATASRGGLGEPAAVPVALAVAAALQLVSLPLYSAISRRYEAEADWQALGATRDRAAAAGLFERFARVNLSDPDPPTWAYLMLWDHPTLAQRVGMARAWSSGRAAELRGGS
jgi:STE24 endopeptidase